MLKESHTSNALYSVILNVLILILMEHAQRDPSQYGGLVSKAAKVLILILMEHAQRVYIILQRFQV